MKAKCSAICSGVSKYDAIDSFIVSVNFLTSSRFCSNVFCFMKPSSLKTKKELPPRNSIIVCSYKSIFTNSLKPFSRYLRSTEPKLLHLLEKSPQSLLWSSHQLRFLPLQHQQ